MRDIILNISYIFAAAFEILDNWLFSWDQDPNQLMNQLKANFTVSSVAVQWTSSADVNQLNNLVGGSNCVNQVRFSQLKKEQPIFVQKKEIFQFHSSGFGIL